MMTQFEQAAIAFHARVEAGAYDAEDRAAMWSAVSAAEETYRDFDIAFCKADGREG